MELAERLQLPVSGIGMCLSLVNASERQGNPATACAAIGAYHEFYLKLASNKAQAHARAIAVKFETEKVQAVAEAQRLGAELLELYDRSRAVIRQCKAMHPYMADAGLTTH